MATAPIPSGTPASHLFARKHDDLVNFSPKQKPADLRAEPEQPSSPIDAVQSKAVVNTSGQITGTTINTSA